MKILVVEDDSFLLNAYRLKFQNMGYEIKMALNGNEMLEILKGWTPDAIILDLMMPNMDGYTALSVLKADEKLKKIPVMVATNLGQKEDVDKAMSMGAESYVVKGDLTLTQLTDKLNELIKVHDR